MGFMINLERLPGDQLKLSVDVAEYREWRRDYNNDMECVSVLGPLDSIAYWMEDHGFTLTTVDAGDHEEWVLRDDFLDDDPRWLTGQEPVYGITEEDAILLEATSSIMLSRWRARVHDDTPDGHMVPCDHKEHRPPPVPNKVWS